MSDCKHNWYVQFFNAHHPERSVLCCSICGLNNESQDHFPDERWYVVQMTLDRTEDSYHVMDEVTYGQFAMLAFGPARVEINTCSVQPTSQAGHIYLMELYRQPVGAAPF